VRRLLPGGGANWGNGGLGRPVHSKRRKKIQKVGRIFLFPSKAKTIFGNGEYRGIGAKKKKTPHSLELGGPGREVDKLST